MFTPNKTNVGTIYCVGRNYALHAKELNNPIPKEPVIFTKARSTLCPLSGEIELPQALGRCDHELEIVVRIGKDLYNGSEDEVLAAISHYGLGLDLTLRDKQSEFKDKKYPWDLAKSFVNACPVAPLIPFENGKDLKNIDFSMTVQKSPRQQGNTADMLFDIVSLIQFISARIPLMAGDLIMTGTPEGVGPLNDGDQLSFTMDSHHVAQVSISRP